MNTINVSKTLELILNNLLTTNADSKITLYLNSPNTTELKSVDTSFSLSVSGNFLIDGTTTTTDAALNILCSSELPIEVKSVGEIVIPKLKVDGSTDKQTLPLNLNLQGEQNLNISGTAKGTLPRLKVEATIPNQSINLPIKGHAQGAINVNLENKIQIPELVAAGKTNSTHVPIAVIGSTAQDVKLHGTVTGIIPQLKVSGSTSKCKLELDLEGKTSADLTASQIDELERIALDRLDLRNMPLRRHTGNNKRNIKLRIVGKATGFIDPLSVNGLTTAESISLPMIEDSSCSFSVISSGQLTIPELDVELKTLQHESTITSEINDDVVLNIIGYATGSIPERKISTHTQDTVIISNVSGKSTGSIKLNSTEEVTIPSVPVNAYTEEITLPLELINSTTSTNTITGTATGKIPATKVTGKGNLEDLPVSGTITTKPNFISKQPCFNGYISSIDSGLLVFREDSTNNLLTLDIDSISYITFETESSIISPNKFSYINTTTNLEKGIINSWYKEGKLQLHGSNTTNPLNKIVDTEDIKYINRGVMWTEEYIYGGILNTVYSIDNLIGFSLLSE